MKINKKLLEKFKATDSKILVVTKYHDTKDTLEIIDEIESNYPDILE